MVRLTLSEPNGGLSTGPLIPCAKDPYLNNRKAKIIVTNGIKKNGFLSSHHQTEKKESQHYNHQQQQQHKNVEETTKKKLSRSNIKKIQEENEPCSLIDAFFTYLCYAVLVLVGYMNDFIRPITTQEKNRPVS